MFEKYVYSLTVRAVDNVVAIGKPFSKSCELRNFTQRRTGNEKIAN
jgi:hypothetical protein